MRKVPRYIAAIMLVAVYAAIILSPLASVVMHSPVIAHAITGECAADCSICGCSPERSAHRTCCCWQKKSLNDHRDDQTESSCCNKGRGDNNKKTEITSLPCGNSGKALLAVISTGELLPYIFSLSELNLVESSLVALNPALQTDWYGEPPKPPPKMLS